MRSKAAEMTRAIVTAGTARRAFRYFERLAGIDQHDRTVLQGLEHVEPIGLGGEHAIEGRHLQHAIEPARDLLLGLRIGLGEKLIFEVGLRGGIEPADVFDERARFDARGAVLEQHHRLV